jgi:UDP-N-acetylglucosamine diphosphorylase/glucosamine-1-phosphate N-acetyltransferase
MTNDELLKNFYPLSLTHDLYELLKGKKQGKYVWELIANLREDLDQEIRVEGSKVMGQVHSTAVLYASENIFIGEGAEVEACAVLDARSGPIIIGKNTIIKPHSYLRGPLSIGQGCRIGGEVAHSIILDFTNKAHYGFIGHSFIGSWVNLGAGTTNSNLKNNYSPVKLDFNGKVIDTGMQFLGCLIGDHAKTGIGTLINTGTIIGVGASVLGKEITKKNIPSFAWVDGAKVDWEKFIATVEIVMKRRAQILTAAEKQRIKAVYDNC